MSRPTGRRIQLRDYRSKLFVKKSFCSFLLPAASASVERVDFVEQILARFMSHIRWIVSGVVDEDVDVPVAKLDRASCDFTCARSIPKVGLNEVCLFARRPYAAAY